MANWMKHGGLTKQMFMQLLQNIFKLPKFPEDIKVDNYQEIKQAWERDIVNLQPPNEIHMQTHFTKEKIDGIKNLLERCGP